jgi:excisionase family DNA binding protein
MRALLRVAVMSALGRALLDELSPDDLAELARRLAPHLPTPAAPTEDGWLTTREAADYLGLSVHALHRLTGARTIAFEQAKPGGKCWFRRSDLDAYRRNDGDY